jgi:hypothetical protein
MMDSILIACLFLNLLFLVRLSNAAEETRGLVRVVYRLLATWADNWPDETVKHKLLVVLRADMTSTPREYPRPQAPQTMGLDFGLGALLLALWRLCAKL